MKERVEVRTQAELDRALAEDKMPICVGKGRFVAWGSSHVVAWGSSHVVAWGSSHVVAWGSSHVEAWGSSHVEARESSHVEARESSHVEAWGSSHVEARGSSHVVARESSHVVARESSHVEAAAAAQVAAHDRSQVQAGQHNAVTDHGPSTTIKGGVIITPPAITTAEAWCEWYGVEVLDGIATLFKAVDDEYRSSWQLPGGGRLAYTPGSTPEAPDWDGGAAECGGGLHFSPSPGGAKGFNYSATRYVACPVALADMAVHHPAIYPAKVKARCVAAPGCYEVDAAGRRIEVAEAVA
jgi:predicted DNA-binding transcriptional regulator AlpA